MKRRRGRKGWAAAAAVLAAVLILAAVFSFSTIRTVKVSGNERYSDQQIIDLLFDSRFSANSAYFYLQYRFRPHKTIPFVEDYKLVFRSLTEAEIIVYEKSVVGYVEYMNSRMYFDKDGVIVESTSGELPGIPKIMGLEFGHVVLHQPLPVEDRSIFGEILNLTQILSVNGIPAERILLDGFGDFTLYLGDLVVKLGGSDQMNGKLAELRDILREYPTLSGTLYLDMYDESNSNPMYRFEKN